MRLHAVLLLVPGLFIGCGGGSSDAPTIVPAGGTLTLDGTAVPDAKLVFYPKEGGVPATATTDSAGKFTLSTKGDGDGAAPGTHAVTASNATSSDSSDPADLAKAKESTLPKKYSAKDTTDLEVVVPDGGSDAIEVKLAK